MTTSIFGNTAVDTSSTEAAAAPAANREFASITDRTSGNKAQKPKDDPKDVFYTNASTVIDDEFTALELGYLYWTRSDANQVQLIDYVVGQPEGQRADTVKALLTNPKTVVETSRPAKKPTHVRMSFRMTDGKGNTIYNLGFFDINQSGSSIEAGIAADLLDPNEKADAIKRILDGLLVSFNSAEKKVVEFDLDSYLVD